MLIIMFLSAYFDDLMFFKSRALIIMQIKLETINDMNIFTIYPRSIIIK